MIKRTAKATLWETIRHSFGGNARDEWEFTVDGIPCKVVNDWREGAKLFVKDVAVSESKKTFVLNETAPHLSTSIVGTSGRERKIEIFVRALTSVGIKVSVDGNSMTETFI